MWFQKLRYIVLLFCADVKYIILDFYIKKVIISIVFRLNINSDLHIRKKSDVTFGGKL